MKGDRYFYHGWTRMNTDKWKGGSLREYRELTPIEFARCRRRRKESIFELDSLRRPLQVQQKGFAVISAIRIKTASKRTRHLRSRIPLGNTPVFIRVHPCPSVVKEILPVSSQLYPK